MKKNCGFTLIEILVALTILASAVAVLFQLFATNLRTLSALPPWGPLR
jgi:prepilin-type N-terminal cleavage/methylation domain-containing protein